jgi:hypothetical protein
MLFVLFPHLGNLYTVTAPKRGPFQSKSGGNAIGAIQNWREKERKKKQFRDCIGKILTL